MRCTGGGLPFADFAKAGPLFSCVSYPCANPPRSITIFCSGLLEQNCVPGYGRCIGTWIVNYQYSCARGVHAFLYFLTTTSTSPDSSFTFAVPQLVGFPLASKRQPNNPAFFSPHCPAFTATTYHPDPDGFPAIFP